MISRRNVSALTLAIALVAAGCGGDDSGSGGGVATGTTAANAVQDEVSKLDLGGTATTVGSTATSAGDAVKHPTSMEDWETLWASEREAVVQKIKDNKWGMSADGTTVTGPEGFTIDLSKCPPGWSNTEGLTDTEIKIGTPPPLSGTLADYGNIAKARPGHPRATTTSKGVFTDCTGKTRNVNLIIKDDGYDPARTIPLVDEFIDSREGLRHLDVWARPSR